MPVVISKKGRIDVKLYSFKTSLTTENKTTNAQMPIMLEVASETELTKVSPKFCSLFFCIVDLFLIFPFKKTANNKEVKICDKSKIYPKFLERNTFSPTASTIKAGPAFTQ